MTVADRVKKMSVNELYDAARGKGGVTEYDNGLATPAAWAEEATDELKRRGFNVPTAVPKDQARLPDDRVSADARFIAMSASKDASRIIKHLWIIFVLLPVVLGILFAILK